MKTLDDLDRSPHPPRRPWLLLVVLLGSFLAFGFLAIRGVPGATIFAIAGGVGAVLAAVTRYMKDDQ